MNEVTTALTRAGSGPGGVARQVFQRRNGKSLTHTKMGANPLDELFVIRKPSELEVQQGVRAPKDEN
jgi:hypothetical protein